MSLDWSGNQLDFIKAHLNVDMTARELGAIYHVSPGDIYRAMADAKRPIGPSSPMGFFTPGGGNLTQRLKLPFATAEDAYHPMDMLAFQARFRRAGWQPSP